MIGNRKISKKIISIGNVGRKAPEAFILTHGSQLNYKNTGPGAIGISEFITVSGGYVTGIRSGYPLGLPPEWDAAGIVRIVGDGGEFIDGYWFPKGTNVIEGAEITSTVDVYGNTLGANGVGIVFRGCKMRGAFPLACIYARLNNAMKIMASYCDLGGTENLHCTDAFRGYGNASAPFIMTRNYLTLSDNAGELHSDVIIEENYFERPYYAVGTHVDGWQFNGGLKNIRISRNKIVLNAWDEERGTYIQQTSNLIFGRNESWGEPLYFGYDNVVIENNYFAGGGYTLYSPATLPLENAVSYNFKIKGNLWSTLLWPKCSAFGPIYNTTRITPDMNAIEWSGNIWSGGPNSNVEIDIPRSSGAYVSFLPTDNNIQYSGRWDMSNPLKPEIGWVGSSIGIVFEGTQIVIKIDDINNWFTYQIDGGSIIKFKFEGSNYCIYGLSDTAHSLKITKITQTSTNSIFNGIDLLIGNVLSTPAPLSLFRYEFVGSGAVLGQSADDPGYSGLIEYFNSRSSYCKVMSIAHGTESRQTAKQGSTLINSSGRSYKDCYLSSSPNSQVEYEFGLWEPTAVFISLDSVDVSDYSKIDLFESAYSELISTIRDKNPDAYIITISPPRGFSNVGYITTISSVISSKEDNKVAFINIDEDGPLLTDEDFVYGTNFVTTVGHIKISNYIAPIVPTIIIGSVIHIISMATNKTSTTIAEGYTEQLTVSFVPTYSTDKTGVWSSSDETKATVSNAGLVTGVAIGNANILFTSNDGGIVVSCAVAVEAVVPLVGVTMELEPTPVITGSIIQMALIFDPENATDKTGVWTSSDEEVATVNQSGLVSTLTDGSFRITFTANDGGFAPYQDFTCYSQNDPYTVYYATTGDTSQLQLANTVANAAHTATIHWSDGTTSVISFDSTALKLVTKTGLGAGVHEHTVVFTHPSEVKTLKANSAGAIKAVYFNNLNILTGLTLLNLAYETNLTSIGRIQNLSLCSSYNFTNCNALDTGDMDQIFADMVISNFSGTPILWHGPLGSTASHDDRAILIARGWTEISATP